jgi:hypothetical protein
MSTVLPVSLGLMSTVLPFPGSHEHSTSRLPGSGSEL